MDASNRPPGVRVLRHGRWSEPGRIYLVTTVTEDRRRWFEDADVAHAVARRTLDPLIVLDGRLHCWVLMPDHLHALVELGAQHTLPRVVQHLKSALGSAANAALGRQGRLWQRGFHDRALRADEDLLTAARYVVANPVRAGLVERVGDYPYWNAAWL
jgi:putative transposase